MDCKKVYGVKPTSKKPEYGKYSHGICLQCRWFHFKVIDLQLELCKLKERIRPIDVNWGRECGRLVRTLLGVKRVWNMLIESPDKLRIRFSE